MKKSVFISVVAGILAAAASVEAVQLKAKLIMPGGKSWDGAIVGRDGDWIEFTPGNSPKPIRLGASTIEQLEFDIKIDQDKLNQMNRNREYERVISALNKVLAPYAEYSDIRSNITQYNALLMELYYKIDNYDKAMEHAAKIVADDRDPELQQKGRVFQALSLISSGKAAEAEKLAGEFGWNEGLDENAPPYQLYIMGKLMALKKDYASAMELVAKVIAFNSQDPDWMQPAELFCAEVYTELGMYDSAEEVIRQISLLYKNTNEDDLAQKLKIKIEKLRAEKELQKTLEEESK